MMKIKRLLSGLLATALVSSTFIFAGCDSEMKSDKVVVTIGNDKIALKDMKGYLAVSEISQELQDYQYSAMYAQQLGVSQTSTWESDESKKSFADTTMDNFVEMYIMNKEAKKEDGYEKKVDEKVKETFEKNADKLLASFSDTMKDKSGITKDDIVEYQKMKYIYDEYKKKLLDSYKVEKDDVKGDIDYDNEYRQYKTTKYSVSLVNQSEDGMSAPTQKSDKEKKEAKETIDKALSMIKDGKSKDDIEKELKDKGLTIEEKNYTQAEAYPDKVKKDDKKDNDKKDDKDTEKKDGTDKKETKVEKYIEKSRELKKDEHTDVIEDESEYSIAVMNDNDSKEAYDAQIETAITDKKNKKYDDKLKELKDSDDYKVNVEEAWKETDFGKLIIDRDEFDKAENKIKKNSNE